jgi:hypothetical protein
MPEELQTTVPAATPPPLPAPNSIEAHVAEMREWLLGHVEGATQHPGLLAMVKELYEEAKLRRERREAFGRALASGGVLAIIGLVGAWLKEHLK